MSVVFLSGVCRAWGGAAADVWVLCAEEETLLVGFFGMDYVRYRERTRVGIPFIQ